MPLVDAVCPHCGAPLKVNPDAKTLTCRYCGNEFVVQDAITNINIKDSKVTNVFNGSTVFINKAKDSDDDYVNLNIYFHKTYYDPFSVLIDGVCVFFSNKKSLETVKVKKGYHTVCVNHGDEEIDTKQYNFQTETYVVVVNRIVRTFKWGIFDDKSNDPDAKTAIDIINRMKK